MPVISFGLELSCELQEPKESLSVRKPPPVLYGMQARLEEYNKAGPK